MKRLGLVLILLCAFCGVANSAYLTQHEVNGTPLLCDINGLSGCNVVSSSPYSHIFGIPLSEYGLLFYGALFVLVALELVLDDTLLRRAVQGIALFGFLASIVFTALQVFVISALCVYCMLSAVLALLIFLFSLGIEPWKEFLFARATTAHRPFTMPPSA